jgi:hypothetical protein
MHLVMRVMHCNPTILFPILGQSVTSVILNKKDKATLVLNP